MNAAAAGRVLAQKEPPKLYSLVEYALQDAALRDLLVEHAFDKDETLRYNSIRVLWRAVDREPRLFYRYWDRFAGMITSPNGFHRSAAAQLIASLASADDDCKLDRLFDDYMRLLDDPKVMVTHYFVETLDHVCRARPDLQKRVMTALLNIDRSKHTRQHKDMLKADILAVCDALFESLPPELQRKSVELAEATLDCTSPKSRKAAKAFIAARTGTH